MINSFACLTSACQTVSNMHARHRSNVPSGGLRALPQMSYAKALFCTSES